MNIALIVGSLHILLLTFAPLFPVFFGKGLDFIYIYFFLLLYLHWTLLNGECIVSLLVKKYLDPTYVTGSNPFLIPDISSLVSPALLTFLLPAFALLVLISNFIVFKRNFGLLLTMILLLFLSFFIFNLRYQRMTFAYLFSRETLKLFVVALLTYFVVQKLA